MKLSLLTFGQSLKYERDFYLPFIWTITYKDHLCALQDLSSASPSSHLAPLVAIHSCLFPMSSFQLNLSSLTLGAKERLARLEASAGSALCSRLSSPSPGIAFSSVSFAPPASSSQVNHVYINSGRNSALTNHHVPAAALSDHELSELLKERHSQKEWANLIHTMNQTLEGIKQMEETAAARAAGLGIENSILAFVTPGRKRKERYDAIDVSPPGASKSVLTTGTTSFDEEIVLLPSQDTQEISREEQISSVLAQWDSIINIINRTSSVIRSLKLSVGEDLESLETKISMVDASVGKPPDGTGFDDCVSVWDGLFLLKNNLENLVRTTETLQESFHQSLQQAVSPQEQEAKMQRMVQDFRQETLAKTDKSFAEVRAGINSLAEFAKILSAEQEKLTERIIDGPLSSNQGSYLDLQCQVDEI